MKPYLVVATSDLSEIWEKTNEFIAQYGEIMKKYPEKEKICGFLTKRVFKAARLFEDRVQGSGPVQPCNGGWDDSVYDWLDEQKEREEAEFDGDFPLGNAADAEFAAQYFTVKQIAYIQCGLFDEVNIGHYVEPAYDVLARKGFIAELKGDYKEALRCYDGDPLPGKQLQSRIDNCKNKLEKGK